jgi:hypothetical protein
MHVMLWLLPVWIAVAFEIGFAMPNFHRRRRVTRHMQSPAQQPAGD